MDRMKTRPQSLRVRLDHRLVNRFIHTSWCNLFVPFVTEENLCHANLILLIEGCARLQWNSRRLVVKLCPESLNHNVGKRGIVCRERSRSSVGAISTRQGVAPAGSNRPEETGHRRLKSRKPAFPKYMF